MPLPTNVEVNMPNPLISRIYLNVRGTELFARRDTLTVVEGSPLGALFSGRWQNQLLRDESGRVFMDIDPSMFKKILEYLFMVKIARDDIPICPKLSTRIKRRSVRTWISSSFKEARILSARKV